MRFEPTDLELDPPGMLDLDLEVGWAHLASGDVVLLPDFEIDLGLHRHFELDLDGSYAIDPRPDAPTVLDNLWLSGKIGVFSVAWHRFGIAGGVQLGPRLPVAHGASGVGVAALALLGFTAPRTHVVFNVGGYLDPAQPISASDTARPLALQLGADVQVDLTRDGKIALHAEVSGVRSFAVDPDQCVLAAGIVYSPSDALDLSVLALFGVLPGHEHSGALAGVSPKLRLWR